jgi:carbonic anhydrase/acetyltransferase-like protein (isoleucine patch superfamily)
MPLYNLGKHSPSIGESVYISESADIIGRVTLGDHSSVWFNSVVRGDINDIYIGSETNIQDLSVLHVVHKLPLIVGNQVTIGHKVTLHACEVEDNCLIGMGSILLDGVKVGKNSVVAAGSLLPPGKVYPSGVLIMGNPGKVVRELTKDELKQYGQHYRSYIQAKNQFLKECHEIKKGPL